MLRYVFYVSCQRGSNLICSHFPLPSSALDIKPWENIIFPHEKILRLMGYAYHRQFGSYTPPLLSVVTHQIGVCELALFAQKGKKSPSSSFPISFQRSFELLPNFTKLLVVYLWFCLFI